MTPRQLGVGRIEPGDSAATVAPFAGFVGERSFTVMRVIHYRNSFLPVIHGSIEDAPGGTIVRLRMRLRVLIAIFMLAWFGVVVSGAERLVSLGLLVFGVLLVAVAFFHEAAKATNMFRRALESK